MNLPALPNVPNYFVLTDSHGKFVPPFITTPTYSIHIMAIFGLKWINSYNPALCTATLLSTSHLHQLLSSANSIMFLIGTNSLRCTPAVTVITQVSDLIHLLRFQHPHLSNKHSITLVACFPCVKPIYPLNTTHSLSNNITQYNTMLMDLSAAMNFTVIDFHVLEHHLGFDRMHLAHQHKHLVHLSIINYFTYLSSIPTPSTVATIGRSAEAKARRNQRRHHKQAIKQRQHFLTRTIHSSWSVLSVKDYLHKNDIKFVKLPPIHRNTLRIQFNNPFDLQVADANLSQNLTPFLFVVYLSSLVSFFFFAVEPKRYVSSPTGYAGRRIMYLTCSNDEHYRLQLSLFHYLLSSDYGFHFHADIICRQESMKIHIDRRQTLIFKFVYLLFFSFCQTVKVLASTVVTYVVANVLLFFSSLCMNWCSLTWTSVHTSFSTPPPDSKTR
uniref:Putative envelope protein n=1 Tax=Philodina roseola TaxID=96448 RepID=A1YGS0_PHIRO|nr:putative envelope protein [Philodina roseola]